MYGAFAEDPQMRINIGIRRRLAPLLTTIAARIELLNVLLLSLPGTPVIYYGDEIGMGDNIYLATAMAYARRCSGPAIAMAASRAPIRSACARHR